jgi:O-antigen ligase
LLALALALPWLIETHTAPWTMFYQDTGMAIGMLAVLASAITRGPSDWEAPGLALGFGGLALVPLLQAAGGLTEYPQEGVVAALYLAGFLLAILTGHHAAMMWEARIGDALFAGLAIAAFACVGLQLYQWVGLDGLGALVQQLPTKGRPSANLGQPNLLATMLVWALIAQWWGYERARIGVAGALIGAAFLLLGVAMTQSRTGWLEVALLAGVAIVRPLSMRRPIALGVIVALAFWFVALVLLWPQLGAWLGLSPALGLADQAAVGKRPEIWRLGLDAIAARPWLGWGWGQGGAAQVALAAHHPSLQIATTYMHNLALDLMVWNGAPIGGFVLIGLGVWFLARCRGEGSSLQRLLLLALAVLSIHAMLELPHGYAVFLLPAGLMMGMVEAYSGARALLTVPRWAVASVAVTLTLALAALVREHQSAERDLMALRMHAARIANLPPLGMAPRLTLMKPIGDLLAAMRVNPERGLDDATVDQFRRVAHHFPSAGNLFRLAQADALNQRPAEAFAALTLLCRVQPPADCRAAGQQWRELSESGDRALAAIEPPKVPPGPLSMSRDAARMPPAIVVVPQSIGTVRLLNP